MIKIYANGLSIVTGQRDNGQFPNITGEGIKRRLYRLMDGCTSYPNFTWIPRISEPPLYIFLCEGRQPCVINKGGRSSSAVIGLVRSKLSCKSNAAPSNNSNVKATKAVATCCYHDKGLSVLGHPNLRLIKWDGFRVLQTPHHPPPTPHPLLSSNYPDDVR